MRLSTRKLASDYDSETDTLYLFARQKASDSQSFGDVVVDYAADGSVVGIEILNASATLYALLSKVPQEISEAGKIKQGFFEGIKAAHASTFTVANFVILVFEIQADALASPLECRMNFPMPTKAENSVARKLARLSVA
ncbi:MAG: DUF2283 domain-containing protein [Candidatus Micrarchaeia archaeon]|jgi:uncharacterized protein YuzE